MKHLKTTFIVSIFLIISACTKDDINAKITGRILKDCSGEPLANYNLTSWLKYTKTNLGAGIESEAFTTDKDGYFSFTSTVDAVHLGKIRTNSNFTILGEFPTEKDLDLGTFYATPTTSFVYRIKVNNPYQVGDTLVIPNFLGFGGYKIPAPLHDSIFPTVLNYSPLATQTYPNSKEGIIPISVGYTIYNGLNNTVNNRLKSEEYTLNLPICNKLDTISIEIN